MKKLIPFRMFFLNITILSKIIKQKYIEYEYETRESCVYITRLKKNINNLFALFSFKQEQTNVVKTFQSSNMEDERFRIFDQLF